MKERVCNFFYGASGLGMVWGFTWGIFMRGWVWLMVGSMIIGVVTMTIDDLTKEG